MRYDATGPTDFSDLLGSAPLPTMWDATSHMVTVIEVDRPISMADADTVGREFAGRLGAGFTVVVTSIEPVQ